MKHLFQNILDSYLDGSPIVNKSTPLYTDLVKNLPLKIRSFLNRDQDFNIKGSMGQGNKTDYPWVAILNKNITTTTQKGLYIVYLFKRDMSGFYLVLGQGITHFADLYKKDKYKAARQVVKYFQDEIDDNIFTKEPIDLCAKRGDLGYGYMKTAILSKYYASNKLDNMALEKDLKHLISIYDNVIRHFNSRSYDSIISSIIDYDNYTSDIENAFISADDAIEIIKKTLDPDGELPFGFNRVLQEVVPMAEKSNKLNKITNPVMRKIDYIKKAKKDAEIGALGESLVLEYEKHRVENIGLYDYVDRIKQFSLKSDSFGYDIRSYDIIDGKIKEIQIEVKTTSSKIDKEFPVSKGEVDASEKYKETYYVYRIYDCNSINPKIYRIRGQIKDNFELNPITYMARLKSDL